MKNKENQEQTEPEVKFLRSVGEEVYVMGQEELDKPYTPVKVKITQIGCQQTSLVTKVYYYFEFLNDKDKALSKYFKRTSSFYVEAESTFTTLEECQKGIIALYKKDIEDSVNHMNSYKQTIQKLKADQDQFEAAINQELASIEKKKKLIKVLENQNDKN